jgi:THO complex subunit 5
LLISPGYDIEHVISGPMNAEDNKLEEDVMEEDEDMQRRRTRPKKELLKEATLDKGGINRLHPLKVMLSVLDENEEKPINLLLLRFEYLVKLNVVCVGVEDGDSSDKDILCNLFPDDTGTDLPHQVFTSSIYVLFFFAFELVG